MNDKKTSIPKFAEHILKTVLLNDDNESLPGDIEEMFAELTEYRSAAYAKAWYWFQIMKLVPQFLIVSFLWSNIMLKSYLKTALRSLTRQKANSIINIFGLSVGLTCAILIYLYVSDELNYDRFHKNSDSIFRIYRSIYNPDGSVDERKPFTPFPMGPEIEKDIPEVKHVVRFVYGMGIVNYENKIFRERIILTDTPVFEVFSFPLAAGDPKTVLTNLNSVVLTENYAKKYFGDEDPMGKSLSMTFGQDRREYYVTGIAENIPDNSTIKFNILVNTENMNSAPGIYPYGKDWGSISFGTYIQIHENASFENIQDNLLKIIEKFRPSDFQEFRDKGGKGAPYTFGLQNIRDIRFNTGLDGAGEPQNAIILSGIALIILLIACINFINLSIGRASIRSVEIGIRKVMGAGRRQLVKQFWVESIIMTLIAMAFGIIFTWLILPVFNSLSNKELYIGNLFGFENISVLILMILITGILSGSFPALVMSRLQPVNILKGRLKFSRKNRFTKFLVVVQFSLSILLIISTLVMGRQINFMNRKDLGFEKEGVVVVLTQETDVEESRRVVNRFREEADNYPEIKSVAGTFVSFTQGDATGDIEIDGESYYYDLFIADYDYVETLGLEIIAGRSFSRDFPSDTGAVIINEKFAGILGPRAEIGSTLKEYNNSTIIGIVKDFNFRPLTDEVTPGMLDIMPRIYFRGMLVKIDARNITNAMSILGKTWSETQPGKPFDYSFFDEDIANQYNIDQKWSLIVRYSSIFAVLIACMGLLGLTSLSVNSRIKEIGIRKVLGAGIFNVTGLVLREFMTLIIIANFISWPLAYYAMNSFLQNYFYRISLHPVDFIFPGILSIIVAVLTILFLALKAARSNPADILRYE